MPAIAVEEGFVAEYELYGIWRRDFALSADSSPGQIRARVCHVSEDDRCSGAVPITATTAPTVVDLTFDTCLSPGDPSEMVTVSAAARGSYTFTKHHVEDAVEITISWTGAYATLAPITHTTTECT